MTTFLQRCSTLFVACCAGFFATAAAAQPILLAVGEWPPYFSQSMRENGVFAHIVKEAFLREGVEVRFEFYPWKRALSLAERGVAQASPGWIQTEERARDFYFSDPVIVSKEVLFYRKDRPINFRTLADLRGKTIGGTLGYSYGADFDAAEKNGDFTVDRAPNDLSSLRKLVAGHVGLVALNRVVGLELLNEFSEKERSQIEVSKLSIAEKQSRLAISRKLPDGEALMKKFNRGLGKVVNDGTAARLLRDAEEGKYLLSQKP